MFCSRQGPHPPAHRPPRTCRDRRVCGAAPVQRKAMPGPSSRARTYPIEMADSRADNGCSATTADGRVATTAGRRSRERGMPCRPRRAACNNNPPEPLPRPAPGAQTGCVSLAPPRVRATPNATGRPQRAHLASAAQPSRLADGGIEPRFVQLKRSCESPLAWAADPQRRARAGYARSRPPEFW